MPTYSCHKRCLLSATSRVRLLQTRFRAPRFAGFAARFRSLGLCHHLRHRRPDGDIANIHCCLGRSVQGLSSITRFLIVLFDTLSGHCIIVLSHEGPTTPLIMCSARDFGRRQICLSVASLRYSVVKQKCYVHYACPTHPNIDTALLDVQYLDSVGESVATVTG
jgi:hypothetical protein